ncbi:ATP-binding cassette domain-containing protein [Gammaproteobacteria bacterium]|nr:ATP-binding cassette domain-containing protein [Gammaproteobacteria bacterium]
MITASSLTKSYGTVSALSNVSFEAASGKVTALLGPNGAGKSTVLRILSTIISPDKGSATIDGLDVTTDTIDVRRKIGVLPHNTGIYDRLTAIENIRYFGNLQQVKRTELNDRIDKLIHLLDMNEFCNRRVSGFSQGQKMKVALARALVHDPQYILLDEPTNGLDVMATRALRKVIHDIKDAGKCILFSSHVMQEVESLCDHLVILGHGKHKFSGTIKELQERSGTANLEDAFVMISSEGGSSR